MNDIENKMQNREGLITDSNNQMNSTPTNTTTIPAINKPPNFSNLSLLDRIKAAQQQLNTKPEVAAMNYNKSSSSGSSGYRAPVAPTSEIKKVPVPKEEDPLGSTTTTANITNSLNYEDDEQIEDQLNMEEDVAFIHEPTHNTQQYNTDVSSSATATTASTSTNYSTNSSDEEQDLQFSTFHIEPMLSSMYQGIQNRVDGFRRPIPSSYDNDTDEPLLSSSNNNTRLEQNYSMKTYCITMSNDIYTFTIGRLPPKYRKVAMVAVIIFFLSLLIHIFDIL